MALTKKYQKKLTKLTDIIALALAMSETSVSKVFNDRKIDRWEFSMLQTLHLEVIDGLSNIGSKMAAEIRSQFEKSLLEGINDLNKELRKRDASSLLYVI